LSIKNAAGRRSLLSTFIVCPNPACQQFTLTLKLYLSREGNFEREELQTVLNEWSLIPNSKAKTFPDYISKVILEDYTEACLIKDLSPKASATLARRCLQGILRDFWGAKARNLKGEIDSIKDKIEPEVWAAIEAVRTLGNIGAHMEKDINEIIDVEPEEAGMLIELIETLLREWYVAREDRKSRMSLIVSAAASKKASPAS
jgi:hypothetical protein